MLQMGFGLVQEQKLKLIMTPELRQSIQILQYSATDLLQFIEEQVVDNPVLELEESSALPDNNLESVLRDPIGNFIKYLHKTPSTSSGIQRDMHKNEEWVERTPIGSKTLIEVLESQLCYYYLDPAVHNACRYLIYNLDERGYLEIEPNFLCKRFQMKQEIALEALKILHSLDPAGVGARNLGECLELQLIRKKSPNLLAIEMAKRFLPEIAARKYKVIAQALNSDMEHIQHAIDEIKTCNPKPGSSYSSTPANYIFPDVVVERIDEKYTVSMQDYHLPRLRMSRRYQQLFVNSQSKDEESYNYLKNWIQSAFWLVKGIEQRRDTIFRVAETIVAKQQEFFKKGKDYLKPLTLKQIAEELEVHESTVSRATQHKYMQTSQGLYPFRFFFPTGLSTDCGVDLSSQTVKSKIQKMIENEEKINPLSDQKLSDQLQADGIQISRRTVTKYRELLKIPSSTVRKR